MGIWCPSIGQKIALAEVVTLWRSTRLAGIFIDLLLVDFPASRGADDTGGLSNKGRDLFQDIIEILMIVLQEYNGIYLTLSNVGLSESSVPPDPLDLGNVSFPMKISISNSTYPSF